MKSFFTSFKIYLKYLIVATFSLTDLAICGYFYNSKAYFPWLIEKILTHHQVNLTDVPESAIWDLHMIFQSSILIIALSVIFIHAIIYLFYTKERSWAKAYILSLAFIHPSLIILIQWIENFQISFNTLMIVLPFINLPLLYINNKLKTKLVFKVRN